MDSLTQATLGAAVGHLCGHRHLGRTSLLWGAALGTLPDLDVLLFPILDGVDRLVWHRGLSHSLLAMVVLSPALGFLVSRVHRGRIPIASAAWMVFWVYATHVLIDVFTVYGTQVLAPFSYARVATNNLFIIDPLFTVPLLLGIGIAALPRCARWASRINRAGLVVSTLYVGFSFFAKSVATHAFERAAARQGLPVVRAMTSPTPFNTLLWRYVGQTDDGYWIGYHSLLDGNDEIRFQFMAQDPSRWRETHESPVIETLVWFSKGYYAIRFDGGDLIFQDLRFGELRERPNDPPERWRFLFAWRLAVTADQATFRSEPSRRENPGVMLGALWARLWGDTSEL